MMRGFRWPKYVPVHERANKARKQIQKLRKNGESCNPIIVDGKSIATTFWGKSWCKNLESYSDFANRLPRGRSYVRNGFVLDLNIFPGRISALVHGSHVYKIEIRIDPVCPEKWKALTKECAGKIDSLLELLQGKFSKGVMEIMTRHDVGLFPSPKEIHLSCSCPDYATMCKHVAAALYGVGARLDANPEALFVLRKVDYTQLIMAAESIDALVGDNTLGSDVIDSADLSTLFGIEMEESELSPKTKQPSKKATVKNKKAKTKIAVKVKTKITKTKRKTKKSVVKRAAPKAVKKSGSMSNRVGK